MLNDTQKRALAEVWTTLQEGSTGPWPLIAPLARLSATGTDVVIDLTTLDTPVIVASPRTTPLPLDRLTPRQREVAALIAEGHPNKVIAARLGLSPATVKDHVHAILARLGLASRAAIIAGASRPQG
jgi:DNA-binding NarL/FixJ family response regulator